MAILHMETELVDEHARGLLRTSTDMLDAADSLKYASRRLKISWEGGSAKQFSQELTSLSQQIQNQIQKLDRIARRIYQEVRDWEEADAVKGSFTDYFGNLDLSIDDGIKLFAGGYLATHLRYSPLRPNSMVFTGPNWMRKLLGIKEATRVIKPTTLVKQMALLAYAENIIEGKVTAVKTFFDPRYYGTNRSVPAAIADGIAKTAILVAGTTALVISAAIVVKVGAIVGATTVVVGGAVIATWTIGSIVVDKLFTNPKWQEWQESFIRDEVIEDRTRKLNEVRNFFTYQAQQGAYRVKQAFQSFRQALLPA